MGCNLSNFSSQIMFLPQMKPTVAPYSHFTSNQTKFHELFVQLFDAIFVLSEPPLDSKTLRKMANEETNFEFSPSWNFLGPEILELDVGQSGP